jgi:hypothetical protein
MGTESNMAPAPFSLECDELLQCNKKENLSRRTGGKGFDILPHSFPAAGASVKPPGFPAAFRSLRFVVEIWEKP